MENTTSKDYCSSCRQDTNHSLLFSKSQGSKPEDEFGWSKKYEIIQCNGCESIQYREVYSDEAMFAYDENGETQELAEDVSYYPHFLKINSIFSNTYYIPPKIRTVYIETIQAFKSKSYLLSGVGFRAIIEAICIEEKIKGKDLEQKIINLLKNKLITDKEANRLHSIRFLGNDSVHEMLVPSEKKLYLVLDIIEHLLRNLYVIDKEAISELDTIIDKKEDFHELIWYRFSALKEEEEKTIKEIVGKNIRRISQENLEIFTKELIADIEEKNIDWLEIGQLKAIGNDPTPIQHFKKVIKNG